MGCAANTASPSENSNEVLRSKYSIAFTDLAPLKGLLANKIIRRIVFQHIQPVMGMLATRWILYVFAVCRIIGGTLHFVVRRIFLSCILIPVLSRARCVYLLVVMYRPVNELYEHVSGTMPLSTSKPTS